MFDFSLTHVVGLFEILSPYKFAKCMNAIFMHVIIFSVNSQFNNFIEKVLHLFLSKGYTKSCYQSSFNCNLQREMEIEI